MTIEQWIAGIAALFSGVSAGGIVFAARQIRLSRKQLNVDVMTKCISEYRVINATQYTTDYNTLYRYMDLVSEELFYIQEKYLPDAVCREWIDGMIDFVPITEKESGKILNSKNCIQQLTTNSLIYFQAFPRARNAFTVCRGYQWDMIYNPGSQFIERRVKERKKLIDEIIVNIQRFNAYN